MMLVLLMLQLLATPLLRANSPLTLDQVLVSAEEHYPLIRKAQSDLQAQQQMQQSRQGAFDPTFTAGYQEALSGYPQQNRHDYGIASQIPGTGLKLEYVFDKTSGTVPMYQGEMATGLDGRQKISLSLPLLRNFLIDKNRGALKIEQGLVEVQTQLQRLTQLETLREAALQYWRWQMRVDNRKTLEELLRFAEATDSFITRRVEKGDAPGIEKVENQKIIAQRRSQVLIAQQQEAESALALSLFYRNSEGRPQIPLEQQSPPWDWSKDHEILLLKQPLPTLKAMIGQLPMIQSVQKEIHVLQLQKRLYDNEWLPQLDLKIQDATYLGPLPFTRNDQREQILGLSFSFPLLNREARGLRASAQSKIESKQFELQLRHERMENQIQQLVLNLKNQTQVLANTQIEYQTSLELVQAEQKRFRAGGSSLFLVNTRESEAALAKIKLNENILVFKSLEAELQLLQNNWIKRY